MQVECTPHLHKATTLATAADAACSSTQAVLAAALQQRQQVQLQVLSLLCSCVKAMAGEWQQHSWKWVTSGCCLAAELSLRIASLEKDLQQAQAYFMAGEASAHLRKWWETHGQATPAMEGLLQQALQHPCGWRLARAADKQTGASLQAAAEIVEKLLQGSQPERGFLEEAPAHSIVLAALMAGMPTTNVSVGDSSLPSSSSSSSSHATQHDGGGDAAGSSSSSSNGGGGLSEAQVEVQLARWSVVTRALHLYGAVLEAALGNPCLYKSATATERAAGAAALTQQLELAKDADLLAPLPRVVQHQLDKNNKQYLSSQTGASAVIGALLHGVYEELESIVFYVDAFTRKLGELQLPQQVVQQLQQHTSELESPLDKALQLWVNLDQRPGSTCGDSDYEAESSCSSTDSKQDPRQAEIAASHQWRWVLNAEGECKNVGAVMQRWAEAVSAQLPSRRCCSNQRCVVLREMSNSNLVNGKACCCGGCSAGGQQAVRCCGQECQHSHWQQHKPVCRRLRRLQQQQQPAAP
jgi:hypothetical protein